MIHVCRDFFFLLPVGTVSRLKCLYERKFLETFKSMNKRFSISYIM